MARRVHVHLHGFDTLLRALDDLAQVHLHAEPWKGVARAPSGSSAGGQWVQGGGKSRVPSGRYSRAETTAVTVPMKRGPLEVLVNPTQSEAAKIADEDQQGFVRVLELKDGTVLAWPATEAIHDQVLDQMRQSGMLDRANRESERHELSRTDLRSARHAAWFRKPGGEGEEFVSPNVGQLSLAEANAALTSKRHADLHAAADDIDKALAVLAEEKDVIGAWKDGAEDSVMAVVRRPDWQSLRAAAAMKGWLAHQRQVLAFMAERDGPDLMLTFTAKGTIADVHKALLEHGVAFHTIVPEGDGLRVMVLDQDGSALDAAEKAATSFGQSVSYVEGRAELIGSHKDEASDAEQRDDARQEYERVIQGASSDKLPAGKAAELWPGLRDRWRGLLEASEGQGEAQGRAQAAAA